MPNKTPDPGPPAPAPSSVPTVRVRPQRGNAAANERHMERCRRLRLWLLAELGTDARWCDVALREIVHAVGRHVGLPDAQPSDGNPSTAVCERLRLYVAAGGDRPKIAMVEILAELADRECRGLVREDTRILAAHKAQHHKRKVERDLRKRRPKIKSENAGLPLDPAAALPVAIARRDELMGA